MSEQSAGTGPIREKLSASRTYYVRTDGSDSNSGLVNSSGGAFLTLQKAIDTVAALDIQTFNVTIQVADGTYTAGVLVSGPWVGSGTVTLTGNTGTPANCVISAAGATCIRVQTGGRLTVSGFKLTGAIAQAVTSNGALYFSSINFGTCTTYHNAIDSGGYLECNGNSYSITGDSGAFMIVTMGGKAEFFGNTVTISGGRTIGTYCFVDRLAVVWSGGDTFVYNSSVVTVTIAAPAVVTWNAHALPAGTPVKFSTTGALPTGIVAGTTYYVSSSNLLTNSFRLSSSAANALAGTNITTTGSQSGTHTATVAGQVGGPYLVAGNSLIFTNGAGTNYFPNNAAGVGTVLTGGTYN